MNAVKPSSSLARCRPKSPVPARCRGDAEVQPTAMAEGACDEPHRQGLRGLVAGAGAVSGPGGTDIAALEMANRSGATGPRMVMQRGSTSFSGEPSASIWSRSS